MSRNRQQIEDSGPKVPAYIVTFSDMVTLLLTFFVLLLSLATVQDPELFNIGRGSFVESIKKFGLGMLPGKTQTPDFGEKKIRHFISKPDNALVVRTIDAKEEEIRRLFQNLTRSMTAVPSQIVAKTTKFLVADIHFSLRDAALNEPAKNFLTQFCLNLQQNIETQTVKFYVLGLAPDGVNEKDQWLLSARRAYVVAEFLNHILPAELQSAVYSWGAGPGGDWVSSESPVSEKLHILIAVLTEDQ